jgi:hypothetical protein
MNQRHWTKVGRRQLVSSPLITFIQRYCLHGSLWLIQSYWSMKLARVNAPLVPRPHTPRQTAALSQQTGLQCLEHPQYSLGYETSDISWALCRRILVACLLLHPFAKPTTLCYVHTITFNSWWNVPEPLGWLCGKVGHCSSFSSWTSFLITSRRILTVYSYFPTDPRVFYVLVCSTAIANAVPPHIAFCSITHESFLSS